ncbi:MAG: hypothetical protein WD775_10900 [Burkholderiales bacterium]
MSRIVANELPISLDGFWSDPKERAAFAKRRAEEIARRMEKRRPEGSGEGGDAAGAAGVLLQCLMISGPFCPLVLALAVPVGATVSYSAARIQAGKGAPYIPISEANGQRLSALFSGSLTGVALGERTLRLVQSGTTPVDTASEFPRLVVTMKSATVRVDAHEELHVAVVAEAQAHPAAGVSWAPTEHVIDMEFWQRYDYTVAVQKILDVLAQSIFETYLPQHPYSVEKRLWDDVRAKDAAQVQTYLDRYPQGAFAGGARQRMTELSAEAAAARQRAADGAASEVPTDEGPAKALFRERARVHPELEGRWTGSAPVSFCGAAFYSILIENGYVEGTVAPQQNGNVTLEVAAYVNEDGAVFAVPVSSGRVDKSRALDLVPKSERLAGSSTVTCQVRHLVSLGRG